MEKGKKGGERGDNEHVCGVRAKSEGFCPHPAHMLYLTIFPYNQKTLVKTPFQI